MKLRARDFIFFISCGLILYATEILAGPLGDGREILRNGDYAVVLEHYRPQAEEGNAEAQKFLGECISEVKVLSKIMRKPQIG